MTNAIPKVKHLKYLFALFLSMSFRSFLPSCCPSCCFSSSTLICISATQDRFRPWVLDFVSVFPLPTYCLLASIGLFSVDMTMSSYFLYGAGLTVYIAVSFFICGCILVALVSAAMRTKKSIDREKKPNTDGQPSAGNEINLRVHELPYYVKVLAALEIKMLEGIEDSVELQDNCLGNLGTVAVIGTLFGGANLASFMSGVEDGQSAGVGQFIGFVRFMAAGGGLITAVYAAVIMAMINTLPKVTYSLFIAFILMFDSSFSIAIMP